MKALAIAALLVAHGSPLVDAAAGVPGLRVEMRYTTSHNLLGRGVSLEARCLLLPETVRALRSAEALVARRGLTLVVWDCYRSPEVQQLLWEKQPTPGLVANPKRGSNHSRGVAVDLTLARADGAPLEMPTDFDDLGPRAARDASHDVSTEAQANRAILKRAMLAAGFTSIRREWWHFDLRGALSYPVVAKP